MHTDERRRALIEQIAQAEAELAKLDDEREARRPPPARSARPLRALVLDALEDLGTPVLSRELMLYLAAVYGERFDPTRFGVLRQQEKRAFTGPRPRSVYIAYGLTEKGEAIKRLLARSDWPLADRVVGPTTGRTQHLRVTKRLCELVAERGERAFDRNALLLLAADHARDLPGLKFRRGEFPTDTWMEIAGSLLAEVEEKDRDAREIIARRLSLRDPFDQTFGTEKMVQPEPRLKTPVTEESLLA